MSFLGLVVLAPRRGAANSQSSDSADRMNAGSPARPGGQGTSTREKRSRYLSLGMLLHPARRLLLLFPPRQCENSGRGGSSPGLCSEGEGQAGLPLRATSAHTALSTWPCARQRPAQGAALKTNAGGRAGTSQEKTSKGDWPWTGGVQLVGASSPTPRGCRFKSQSGPVPGLQVWVWGTYGRQLTNDVSLSHQCFSLGLSRPLSLQ